MANYAYVAIDPHGTETRGTLHVADQNEAVRRIKQMGFFPTQVLATDSPKRMALAGSPGVGRRHGLKLELRIPWLSGRVKPGRLLIFTRQLATLVQAGMPLLRSLRILEEQEESRTLRRVIGDLAFSVESGGSFTEAVGEHPRIFNRLYVNMVKAGEIGGAQEVTLARLAEFMEKAQKLKGRIKAAMCYPCTVLLMAMGILSFLMVFVLPRFQAVFTDLLAGVALPAFTRFVFGLSAAVANHFLWIATGCGALTILLVMATHTVGGRWAFDKLKLVCPVVGPLFRKVAVSRVARTLGTLASNGVPILQALSIVKETAGNVVVGRLIAEVHDNVKQGEPMTPTFRNSVIFPPMIVGMIDVGEQTGALPEMLLKIADNYDDEVETATSAMISLLEPFMLVFLAVVIGGIVIAMFLPLLYIYHDFGGEGGPGGL